MIFIIMTSTEIIAKYGQPGHPENLVMINLPYPMKIAWDLTHSVTRMQIHKDCAESVKAIFTDILAHYGLVEIQRLKIDYFGGSYNFRKMRNGTEWSVHSWGCAIDLDPQENALEEHADKALFAKPEYKAMIDIFYKHGWFSLGREKNYDWMHFQAFKP